MMRKNWKNLLVRFFSLFVIGLFLINFIPFSVARQKDYRAEEVPHPLKGITVTEKLGHSIDLDLVFFNEQNQSLALGEYFGPEPVLMSVVYYNCPSLCNFQLNGLFETLERLSVDWKSPYQLLLVSMDESEKAALAKEKRANYLKEFQNLPADRIHFLTGSKNSIKELTDSLGFAFRWDEETEQFAHSPVAYVLTAKGLISRYLYGIEFEPQTLKLSLLEAGAGKIGNMIDRILLFCYRFNPKENKYTVYASNIMRAGGILIILALLLLLVPVWMKERNQNN